MATIRDQIIWLAGLLEGEGCFRYQKGSGPRITLAMTDRDTIEKVSVIWGAPFYKIKAKKKCHKDYYTMTIHGSKAISWMMSIYSLMSERRKTKIKEIIMIWKKAQNYPKLNIIKVHSIREDYSKGLSYRELGRKYDVSKSNIGSIVNNITWRI